MSQTDSIDDLLLLVAKGDRVAFRRLYRLRASKLMGIVLRIVSDRGLAEDALQDAFVEIWNRADRFDPARGRAESWMGTIARNRAIDILRRRGRRVAPGEDLGDDALVDIVDPAQVKDGGAEFMALTECLSRLDPTQREAVLMAYYWGASREELAERMDRPVNTIKTWLRRSLAALRTCLDDHG